MQVTVFTPAYNRGYIIKNLYISLCAQKNKNFEWLIVDDGSTDNTGELIKEWQAQNNGFDIIYIKTENGGKHRAINTGVRLAVPINLRELPEQEAMIKLIISDKLLPVATTLTLEIRKESIIILTVIKPRLILQKF